MTDWPSRSLSHCAMMRPTMSVLPPAGNGTMKRMGRLGQDWARAGRARAEAPVRAARRRRLRRFIAMSLLFVIASEAKQSRCIHLQIASILPQRVGPLPRLRGRGIADE